MCVDSAVADILIKALDRWYRFWTTTSITKGLLQTYHTDPFPILNIATSHDVVTKPHDRGGDPNTGAKINLCVI